jgi:Uma2 family endonuclease
MLVIENQPKPKTRVIPASLAYEEMNGEALPYKGYLEVLAGNKEIEEIMGSSSLQAAVVYAIGLFLGNNLNRKKYLITTNESGLHLSRGNNLANDIAIFEKEKIRLDDQYFNVAPKVVVEVDIKADLSETSWTSEMAYTFTKSQKMLDFGVEKVIWINTHNRRIFVNTSDQEWSGLDWHYADFDRDILVLDDCVLNLARLLAEEGIEWA